LTSVDGENKKLKTAEPIMKRMYACVLLTLFAGVLFCQERKIGKEVLIANIFAPGTLQIAQGKTEGYWYTPGTALMVGGLLLIGKNYAPMTPDVSLSVPAGWLLEKTGEMMFGYSWYACYNDDGYVWPTMRRESLPVLMASAYSPECVFSADVLPFVGIGILCSVPVLFEGSRSSDIGTFFGSERVDFWGASINPYLAFGCYFAYTLVFCDINAVSEEVVCRGIISGRMSQLGSAATFGGMHSLNLLMMPLTPENIRDTSLQVGGAFLIGLYLDKLTRERNGSLRECVALHHWWNVGAMTLAFLSAISEPEYVRKHYASPTESGESLSLAPYFDADSHPGICMTYSY
jgi:membrane protease YdiL (CAAX protease family)